MTEAKTCKCCGVIYPIFAFPLVEKSGMRHSFCQHCFHTLRFCQVVRWHHYFNPNFKPTRGWNPFK